MIPFLDRLSSASRVIIAGIGGKCDVFAGIPIAAHLRGRGARVSFVNLSSAQLDDAGAERLGDLLWKIDHDCRDLAFFPERWLAEWIERRGWGVDVYALKRAGVAPLERAWKTLIERLRPDLVLLVDGGSDSLSFGDEARLGAVVEEAVSLVSAVGAAEDRCLLATIGFGADGLQGTSPHDILHNIAQLMRGGDFLGSFGLTPGTPGVTAFLDLVEFANRRQPRHQDVLTNCLAQALRGGFGDAEVSGLGTGSERFVTPLMTQYWTFAAPAVVAAMGFAPTLSRTETFGQARRLIEGYHAAQKRRPYRPLPL